MGLFGGQPCGQAGCGLLLQTQVKRGGQLQHLPSSSKAVVNSLPVISSRKRDTNGQCGNGGVRGMFLIIKIVCLLALSVQGR